MPPPLIAGGWGQVAWGQHEWGAGQSAVEPRFNRSGPIDGAHNVSRESWLEFEVYYFSSFPAETLSSLTVYEISEDGGANFVDAAVAPYALTARFIGGHTLWVKIVKTGLWASASEIVIRTTRPDEFSGEITKELPVRWG